MATRSLPRAFDRAPRHVEVQILADNYGTRPGYRGARLLDAAAPPEAGRGSAGAEPPPQDPRALFRAAIKGAKAAEYTNAGTLEFLVDQDGNFYFMEMNTRIQVEHPVTEMVTGIDLVAWQIRIAAGERLTLTERDCEPQGHAIECRITAEDAGDQFMPSVGTVETYVAPGGPGVRVDSHLYSGYSVPPHYDSLLAKSSPGVRTAMRPWRAWNER